MFNRVLDALTRNLPPRSFAGRTPTCRCHRWHDHDTALAYSATPHARHWPPLVLGILATVLAGAALIVALIRTSAGSPQTHTAAQKAEAKTQLCERYKLALGAVSVETGPQSDGDIALPRISLTHGALILETAAGDPALDHKYRDAAEDLAGADQTTAALATRGMAISQQYEDAVTDSNGKRDVMEKLCAN